MSIDLNDLFHDIDVRHLESFEVEDARAIIAALCVTALCDELLTISEKLSVAGQLEDRWSITMQPDALEAVFERVALAPRQDLVLAISSRSKFWTPGQKTSVFEALINVVASDENISRAEFRLLQAICAKLGFDKDILRLAAVSHEGEDEEILGRVGISEGETLRLGRSFAMEIRLPKAPIAACQASLTLRHGRLEIHEVSDEKILIYRGEPLSKTVFIQPGEQVSVGRYRLRFESKPSRVVIIQHSAATTIKVQQVNFAIPFRGGSRPLLRNISFTARAREMVAIIGPSGCGKSTLLSVLTGIVQASSGQLTLDDFPIGPGMEAAIRRISFVPQDELLFADLTVEESVAISARLKGLGKSAVADFGNLVAEILERLGLFQTEIRSTRIGDTVKRGISGGQRKRVSVAQELVGDDTDVLLLDEPTSGLDPRSEANVISMLREISDGGKLVMITTHGGVVGKLSNFDKVLCLATGGRQAYYGSPNDLLRHFGVTSFNDIYEKLEQWNESDQFDTQAGALDGNEARQQATRRPLGFLQQLFILAGRHLTVRFRDRAGVLLALVFPLTVVAILRIVYRPECVEPSSLFVVGLASLWSGMSFTVRDLIADFAVVRHESRSRTTIGATYVSKALVGGLVSLIQALLLVLIIFPVLGVENVYNYKGWSDSANNNILSSVNLMSPWFLFSVLFAAHALGNALGLLLSAAFNTADAAIFTIPLVLLPLLASAGILVVPRDLPKWLFPAIDANPLFWTYTGLLASSANTCKPLASFDPDAKEDWGGCQDERFRRTMPPDSRDSSSRNIPFVRSVASCVYNYYYVNVEFLEEFGFAFNEPKDEEGKPSGDPVDHLQSGRFYKSISALVALSAIFHAGAFYIFRWRIRRYSH